jgi:hypothetical protein
MGPQEVGRLTMRQLSHYLANISYVDANLTTFGKPPAMKLPQTKLTRYANRCGVVIPYSVHLDLVTGE